MDPSPEPLGSHEVGDDEDIWDEGGDEVMEGGEDEGGEDELVIPVLEGGDPLFIMVHNIVFPDPWPGKSPIIRGVGGKPQLR